MNIPELQIRHARALKLARNASKAARQLRQRGSGVYPFFFGRKSDFEIHPKHKRWMRNLSRVEAAEIKWNAEARKIVKSIFT